MPPKKKSKVATTMEDNPLFKAFDNPGIFGHIVQYLLVKKKYFVAVNDNIYHSGHRGQLCRIEMKSRYRWIPNQGGVGTVDGEEDYMTTERIPLFTPAIASIWTPTGSFGFAIDNDSGTSAMRLRCHSNGGDDSSYAITFYAPGQYPKIMIMPAPHNLIDICIVKTTVFVSTLISFGCVDFAVEEPIYVPIIFSAAIYFNLANTGRFVFGLRGQSDERMRTECKEIDCFELTTNQMPELKHSWTIRSPNENLGVHLNNDFQYLAIVDQGDSFCVAFMTPNCNQDASLIDAHEVNANDGNVGIWMLTRIIVSKDQDNFIEEVRLPLDGVTEVTGMIIRESSKEILIAAGRQGLLMVPLLFNGETQPRVLFQPTDIQTILGVQLFNDISYVFVKATWLGGGEENDINSYSIIKVGSASNIMQVSRSIPLIQQLEQQGLDSYERMM